MKTIMWVAVFIVVLVVVFTTSSQKGLDVEQIAVEISRGQAVLLDVRTDEELAVDGYAENSRHFDLARLEAGEVPEFTLDTKIYTYCKGGVRAGKAKEILETAGFTSVENIGGLADWEAAGGIVVQ